MLRNLMKIEFRVEMETVERVEYVRQNSSSSRKRFAWENLKYFAQTTFHFRMRRFFFTWILKKSSLLIARWTSSSVEKSKGMTHESLEDIFKFSLSQNDRDLPLIVSNPLNNIVIEYEMEKNVMIKIEFHYFYMDSEWGEFEKLLSTRSNFIVMQNSWSRRSWICLLHRSLSSFSYFFLKREEKFTNFWSSN